jgi:hypothetical protein
VRRLTEKNPKNLIALGVRLAEAKRTLSPDAYEAFMRRERELRHEAKPGQLLHDKAHRLIRIASMRVFRDYIDNLPWTGWSTLRELPKLGEPTLRCLLDRGAINRSSTREDIDRLRSAQKPNNVATIAFRRWRSGAAALFGSLSGSCEST